MYDKYLPFFDYKALDSNNIKKNTELLFLQIFLNQASIDELNFSKSFIHQFLENMSDLDESTVAPYLVIKLYACYFDIFHPSLDIEVDKIVTDEQFHSLIDAELDCYYNLISGNPVSRINEYLSSNEFNQIFHTIITEDSLYSFTHRMFYLSYLNRNTLYIRQIPNQIKKKLRIYTDTAIMYCILIENVDILGEIMIVRILLECEFDFANPLFQKAMNVCFQYLNTLETISSETKKLIEEEYHTVCVLKMLSGLLCVGNS